MTQAQRPYGGTNDSEGGSGTHAEHDSVGADPANSPRAAQGGAMSDDVTSVPEGGSDDPDAKAAGMPDATGPQG